jgi:hypothetical protein
VSEPRVTLVGESNPYGSDPHYALYPLPERASGGRLCAVLGLTPRKYLRRFRRVNLLDGPRWSAPKARARAWAVASACPPGGALVLCGARVAAAFGHDFARSLLQPKATLYVGEEERAVRSLVVPHPSGLSRLWCEAGMAERVRAAIEALCAGPGESGPPSAVDADDDAEHDLIAALATADASSVRA